MVHYVNVFIYLYFGKKMFVVTLNIPVKGTICLSEQEGLCAPELCWYMNSKL